MPPLLVADQLTKHHPAADGRSTTALHDVSLAVEPGELVTVVGPSGSGKSTLLQCLAGLDSPTGGRVVLAGVDLASLRGDALAAFRREHLGVVFQSYNLIPSLTAAEAVALPLRLARRRGGARDRRGRDRGDRARVRAALDAVGLSDLADRRPSQLSGGQQQRVAIARTLVTEPDVVFADEPTGALDTESGRAVLELLRGAAAGDRSVVMVTHDLEAAALGDRVLVLRDGRLHRELRGATPAGVLAAVADAVADDDDAAAVEQGDR
jgi:putative ABC transport system ATP-binding protein